MARAKPFDGRRESRGYFLDVAKFYDRDYDPDVDAEPRFWCAHRVLGVNARTAAVYLLNAELADVAPAALAETMSWLEARRGLSAMALEMAAESFLRDLSARYGQPDPGQV